MEEKRKPNVLVISDYRRFQSTRPEAVIFIELAKRGYPITIMSFPDSAHRQAFEEAGIDFIPFHPTKKFHRESVKKIRECLIEKNIEVLHCYNSKASANGIKAVKGLDVKLVLYRGYPGNVHWFDPTAYFKYLNPRVDAIICNSQGVEDHFHKQPFFDKSKTYTICKGHDPEWFSNIQELNLREKFNLPADAFVMGTVANNRSEKGIPFLLRSLGKLPPQLPIHHILIGDKMDSKENLKLIKKLRLEEKVHFSGYQPKVLPLVKGLDVFILSSIRAESITKSVIEAMSLGVATIITDLPGNRELVDHGKSGLIVERNNPDDLARAILNLYQNPEVREKLSAEAPKHIKSRLHRLQTVEGMENLYRSLFESH